MINYHLIFKTATFKYLSVVNALVVPAFRGESWDPWDVAAQCVFYKMVIISSDNVRLINSRVPMSEYQMGSHVTITRRPIIIVLWYPGNLFSHPILSDHDHMSHGGLSSCRSPARPAHWSVAGQLWPVIGWPLSRIRMWLRCGSGDDIIQSVVSNLLRGHLSFNHF